MIDVASPLPRLAVSCVVLRDQAVLLVRRARAPAKGWWAFPGGSVMAGERVEHAVRREVLEETALRVGKPRLLRAHEVIERDETGGRLAHHYVILVHAAELEPADTASEPVAGDDAAEARFVAVSALDQLDVLPSVLDVLPSALEALRAPEAIPTPPA